MDVWVPGNDDEKGDNGDCGKQGPHGPNMVV